MACVWGLLGASALEAHQLRGDIARVKNLPWRVRGELPLGPYLTALGLRLALGVGLAAGFGASGQAGGPVGVMAVGIAAPKVLEQLAGRKVAELQAEARQSAPEVAPEPAQESAAEPAPAPDTGPAPAEADGARPAGEAEERPAGGAERDAVEGATGERH